MRIGRTLPPAASPIPLLDILRALPACFRSGALDDHFAQEIMREYGSKHCFLLSSGKAALTLSLLALKKIYPGRDEVVIPAYTCYSVPAAVKRAGLKIRLCDLAPFSLDFDKEQLKSIIETDKQEKKILCVLATHLFGCPADFAGIQTIVGPEIPIIEDAAQAMGETLNNKKLGTLGDVGFFSLGRGKALSTMEGGIIITDRDDIANIIKALIVPLTGCSVLDNFNLAVKTVMATILVYPSLFWLPKALPFLKLGETLYEPDFVQRKFSYFQVKLARNWQNRLERHRRARQKNIGYWQAELPSSFSHINPKGDISLIRLPILAQTREQRDNIIKKSEQQGLGIMLAYPTPINEITQIAEEFTEQNYPNAKRLAECLLTLPVNEYVLGRDNKLILSLVLGCKEQER